MCDQGDMLGRHAKFVLLAALCVVGLTSRPLHSARKAEAIPVLPEDRAAVAEATKAVCNRKIVLLGEAAHGNGHSDAFKSAMVEQLVERCGFRTILFEASFYEFVPIWRARREGRTVTRDMIATAIGGLWRFDREFQPLLDFLGARANKDLVLGGIDFQIGGLQQDYANKGMIAELTSSLDPAEKAACGQLVEARMVKGLTREQKALAAKCVGNIAQHLSTGNADTAAEHRAMLQNLGAFLASDFEGGPGPMIAARDRQMFRNLQFLRSGLARGTRIIVWTANAHAANGADESSGFAGVRNLGSYVAEAFGRQSYALGTTAFSGTQRWGRAAKAIAVGPDGSLEARTFNGESQDSVFYNTGKLRKLDSIPAGLFGYNYATTRWSRRFDGIVVFHSEFAAFNSRHGN